MHRLYCKILSALQNLEIGKRIDEWIGEPTAKLERLDQLRTMDPNDEIIQLIIKNQNEEAKVLNVHRGVFGKSSGFFHSALKPEWMQQREKAKFIELVDEDVETVSKYIRWLYYDTLLIEPPLSADIPKNEEELLDQADAIFMSLAKAYVFGEKYVDIQFKNAAMEAIVKVQKKYRTVPDPSVAKMVCKGIPTGSPLQRWFGDSYAYNAEDNENWMWLIENCPKKTLVDALKVMTRIRPRVGPDISADIEKYLEKEQ